MLNLLLFIQLIVFAVFSLLEALYPARSQKRPRYFVHCFTFVVIFGTLWLRGVLAIWSEFDIAIVDLRGSPWASGVLFYCCVYSLFNYWTHRLKHRNSWLWRYVHKLHHCPPHMQAHLAFFRHPLEMVFNSAVFLILAKLLNLPFEAVCVALMIEGCLECFHHSNIRVPKWMQPLGYVVQLPGMHLIHHQYGLHSHNYGPFLWDWVFGTIKFAPKYDVKIGFKDSDDIKDYIFLKNS